MSSSILHQCPFCGHISDISLSLAAFIENPHCAQCGLSVSESSTKLQDELSALFDRQMTMNQPQPINSTPPPTSTTSQQPITYSITQHYHHSSHVAPPPQQTPAQPDQTQALTTLLLQHGINPSTLTPSQLSLITHADPQQQQRLLQTWQLYAVHSQPNSNDTAMDDFMDEHKGPDAEPYMVSGYESASASTLPKEPSTGEPYVASTDPVYMSQQWWEVAPGSVESQYGLFEERQRYSRMHGCAGVQTPQWLCPN
ncbi:uncharacterized protein N7496_010169 [Penicillium cataractarum]|uniref:Uncharacterized protein n=1 Tax=Penicillium cataractarum TaxID=2100454 RepID=A0A9W9RQC7_9EURO|nr:uncharacterized protein N7496_010169 [Penicillium cataractarum]KAJ5364456.1 hypothetical protein N7496_010169 [Penicillium cataractarum]